MFNPLIRTVLRSRLHWLLSRWLVLLTWKSRKSGRQRTTPLSYVRDGSAVYLTTAERWSADLIEVVPVRVRLDGRWYDGHAGVVSDRNESMKLFDRLFREHPWFRVLAGIPKAGSGGGGGCRRPQTNPRIWARPHSGVTTTRLSFVMGVQPFVAIE